MPRRSAEARTSAACVASGWGTPKWRKMRVLNSWSASIGKILASTAGMVAFLGWIQRWANSRFDFSFARKHWPSVFGSCSEGTLILEIQLEERSVSSHPPQDKAALLQARSFYRFFTGNGYTRAMKTPAPLHNVSPATEGKARKKDLD